MKTVAIIQARMGSGRLPGKILKPMLGEPMLVRMLERVKRAKKLDAIVVATTDKAIDDPTVEVVKAAGVGVLRGDEDDVLDRFYRAAKESQADLIVRLTGDCVLMDPAVIDEVVEHFEAGGGAFDYTSTPRNYPEGLDIEIFTFKALEDAHQKAELPSEREHVSPFIKNHPERLMIDSWEKGQDDHTSMHWSVDTEADFEFATEVFKELYPHNPNFTKDDVLALLARKPELLKINRGGTGYEGLAKSLKEDEEYKKHHHS